MSACYPRPARPWRCPSRFRLRARRDCVSRVRHTAFLGGSPVAAVGLCRCPGAEQAVAVDGGLRRERSGLAPALATVAMAEMARSKGVQSMAERVPDEELPNLFDAVDAVVVIRQNSMSSGVPSMAMTFGRFVIAPNLGAMPEYLAGTENALYDQSSAEDLARAMERAAAADREGVGKKNARIAAGWGWDAIVQTCLDALPPGGCERRLLIG